MSWEVQWTKCALRAASRLDRPTRERIAKEVESFATTGQGDVKRLKGKLDGLFRLRVGDWRIFFSKEGGRLFDAVKMMREIRDDLSRKLMTMSHEEQQRYIKVQRTCTSSLKWWQPPCWRTLNTLPQPRSTAPTWWLAGTSKHIVNLRRIHGFNAVNLREGVSAPRDSDTS